MCWKESTGCSVVCRKAEKKEKEEVREKRGGRTREKEKGRILEREGKLDKQWMERKIVWRDKENKDGENNERGSKWKSDARYKDKISAKR